MSLFIFYECSKMSWFKDVEFHIVQVCYCDWSHEHFISKALMTGVALTAAIVHFQMCLFPPYIHIFYCCHGYCFHLSIHPFWQGFKGICSLLVNVIKGCWSVMQIVRLLSWEFSQFLSWNSFISFSAQDEALYLSNCCSVKWNHVSSNLLLLFWDNEKLPDTVE